MKSVLIGSVLRLLGHMKRMAAAFLTKRVKIASVDDRGTQEEIKDRFDR